MAKTDRELEKEIANEEKTMRDILDAQEKVPIFIPDDPLNPDDVVPVGINGVIYAIPRGQQFMVPKSVFEVWHNSYNDTAKANKRIAVKKDKDIQVYG